MASSSQDQAIVTALYVSTLDLRPAYMTALRGAERFLKRPVFADVYEQPQAPSDRGVDIVVAAVRAEEVETAGARMLLAGANSNYSAGRRLGFGVAVMGADSSEPVERITAELDTLGCDPARVEAVAGRDDFLDTVQRWLCVFSLGTGVVESPPVAGVDTTGALYDFGAGL